MRLFRLVSIVQVAAAVVAAAEHPAAADHFAQLLLDNLHIPAGRSVAPPTYADTTDRSRIAIVMLCTPSIEAYGKYAVAVNHAYAQHHGFDFVVDDGAGHNPERHVAWHKLQLVRRVLRERRDDDGGGAVDRYEWVVYIDADAAIARFDVSLRHFIARAAHVRRARDRGPPMLMVAHDLCTAVACPEQWHVNSGVVFYRNDPWTRRFVDTWYAAMQGGRGFGWDPATGARVGWEQHVLRDLLAADTAGAQQHAAVWAPHAFNANVVHRAFGHRPDLEHPERWTTPYWIPFDGTYGAGDGEEEEGGGTFMFHLANTDTLRRACALSRVFGMLADHARRHGAYGLRVTRRAPFFRYLGHALIPHGEGGGGGGEQEELTTWVLELLRCAARAGADVESLAGTEMTFDTRYYGTPGTLAVTL